MTEFVYEGVLPSKYPKCGNCGHSESQHSGHVLWRLKGTVGKNGGRYPCGGCQCPKWVDSE